MKLFVIRFALALAASLMPLCLLAQTARQTGLAQGVTLFDKGDYEQARLALFAEAASDERDPKVNFYFGAAEAMTSHDLPDALRRLHLAQLRGFRRADANLFIGRAYQLLCEYDQARAALAKFIQSSKDERLLALARRFDSECQNSISLAGKIFKLRVAGKTQCLRSEAAGAYAAGKECGTVCKNSHFFQSDIDPDGLMYMTERADAVYFSVADDEGFSRLMKMEKLIGGWGEMTQLRGLEGQWNDIAPVLMTDGVTVYFASDRPGGMGGYDIYKTTYDPETRTYSEPVNMGVPFNSAFDDFLLMPDEFNGRAWFSSGRETAGTDSVTVYEVEWSPTLVRTTASSTGDITAALALTPDPELRPASTGGAARQSQQSYARDRSFVPQDVFRFPVCDSLTYTQWEHFRSKQAERTYRQVVRAQAERDSLVSLMSRQRKEFMSLASSIERNAKLQDLLRTERSLYSLEDEISEKAEAAKNEELGEIARLVSSGEYTPLSRIKVANPNAPKLTGDAWLRPEAFSVFSPVFFRDAHAEEDDDVLALFTEQQRALILQEDSMLAWARIVALEASSLDAKALSPATSDDDAAALAAKADAFRVAAARLASDAYDRLFDLYAAKYRVFIATLQGYDKSELTELYDKAMAARNAAPADGVANSDASRREERLAAQRRAQSLMVKCMQRYSVHADGSFPLPASDSTSELPAAPSPSPVTDNSDATPDEIPESTPNEAREVSPEASAPESVPEASAPSVPATPAAAALPYRIQLGAFRKRPEALALLPDESKVSSIFIAERGVTRFYYGSYASAADASADLSVARKAGFSGAFAVKVD